MFYVIESDRVVYQSSSPHLAQMRAKQIQGALLLQLLPAIAAPEPVAFLQECENKLETEQCVT